MKRRIFILIALIVVFSLSVFLWNTLVLPKLPLKFQTGITTFLAAFFFSIAVFSSIAQITGYSLKDFISKNEKIPSTNLTQIDGTHKAKGEGNVTGLDIKRPVIIKPGTKSIAEGKGNITATRISNEEEK